MISGRTHSKLQQRLFLDGKLRSLGTGVGKRLIFHYIYILGHFSEVCVMYLAYLLKRIQNLKKKPKTLSSAKLTIQAYMNLWFT